MKKRKNHLCIIINLIYAGIFIFFESFFPNISLSETIKDTKIFKSDNYFWGAAFWTHEIQKGFFVKTADIKLQIRVSEFNDWGTLDLFCSDSNNFDYGSVTEAPTQKGFIRRIKRADTPEKDIFYEIRGALNQNQIEWLNNDGKIYLGLIGYEYRFPVGGYRAIFYLKLSELTVTIITSTKPNLIPYKPINWSDKIVISKIIGTANDSSSFTVNDSLYLSWAILNNSNIDILTKFSTTLFIDGVEKMTWNTNSLEVDYYAYVQDYPIGKLSAGNHQLKIVTDSTNVIPESDEQDNTYTKIISVFEDGKILKSMPWLDLLLKDE
jgi:hypothetical protein